MNTSIAKKLSDDASFVETPEIFVLAKSQISGLEGEIYHKFGAQPTESTFSIESIIETAGRTCYLSFANPSGKTTGEYIRNLIRHGHESVLEHVSWTFVIAGVSRAFTHQLVRHRVGFSYSQLSQQYVDHRSIRFVIPAELLKHPELVVPWKETVLAQRNAYIELIESLDHSPSPVKSSKEKLRSVRSAARSVLPNCVEAVIAVTANARAWRHFLEVRGATEGDIEMRRVSALLLKALKHDAPSIFFDFSQRSLEDGWPIVMKNAV
ncbi:MULTISPECIES: FAD-dependent thymidylate synthase [unclassified Bradyrhizobium]|uniref:FAD-dependent thymidylate synthase n=1 Tax=unclassified Bradyrhizobium TaxID=2631580 RepID=UPI0028E93088|nr:MULTISPECIES: FAD-dependent thymidylate synthase [unclassified Bradyrhizobium]